MDSNPRIPFELSSHRKRLEPLNGRPLMVNVVMNIEYWPYDRPMPRGILPPPHGAQIAPPDLPNYSWVEYGMRCGMPRFLDMMRARRLKATTFFNAQVADVYPSLTKEVLDAGWEFVGHGWFQRSLKQVEDEEAEIRMCLDRLKSLTGKKTRGWFGAGGAETMRTPEFSSSWGSSSCTTSWSTISPAGCAPRTGRCWRCPIRWRSTTCRSGPSRGNRRTSS